MIELFEALLCLEKCHWDSISNFARKSIQSAAAARKVSFCSTQWLWHCSSIPKQGLALAVAWLLALLGGYGASRKAKPVETGRPGAGGQKGQASRPQEKATP
jgi:hypothetical protein